MIKRLLSTPADQLGKAGRFLVFQIKLWPHCARLLKDNRASQQAAALSYHSIFGIVPMAIIMLLIFQSFPTYSNIGQKTKNLVYEQLHLSNIEYPDPVNQQETVRLTDYIDEISAGFFEGVNHGSIAIVSIVLIIFIAVTMLSIIERTFNSIWHVGRGRSFVQRFVNYWALLTLGPLLLGTGIYITTRYALVGQLQQTILLHLGPAVLSYLIATAAFFALYFVLPNTTVQAKAALWGAAAAALLWSVAKWGFGLYVTGFIPYQKVYGVLGLIPLTVLWIYISWLVVLFGLQLTFTSQHLKTLDAARISSDRKNQQHFIANEITVINILAEIVRAFEANNAPVQAEIICSKLDIPGQFGEKILNHLVSCGIIVKVSEPKEGFMPAKKPCNIQLTEVTEAVARAGLAQQPEHQQGTLGQIIQSQKQVLAGYNLGQVSRQQQKQD